MLILYSVVYIWVAATDIASQIFEQNHNVLTFAILYLIASFARF